MGIRGLTKLVDTSNILESFVIKPSNSQKLVIDGTSLSYQIYESSLDWRIGQYKQFAQLLTDYIQTLQQCGGIIETVVFDSGRGNPRKRSTRLKRDSTRINILVKLCNRQKTNPSIHLNQDYPSTSVLPALTHMIAIQTLKNLNISVVIAKEEADKVIASIAEATSSIVLGNDSDYMIFPLSKGYIPIKTVSMIGNTLYALHFQQTRLAKHLKLKKEFLTLLPCLLGCDYVPYDYLRDNVYFPLWKSYVNHFQAIQTVLTSLNQSSSLQDAFHAFYHYFKLSPTSPIKLTLDSYFQETLQEYTLENHLTDTSRIDADFTDPYGVLTDPVCFKVFFCFPLVEDLDLETSWVMSRPLRSSAYYRKIGSDAIVEYQREELSLNTIIVDSNDCFTHEEWMELESYPTLMQRTLRFLIQKQFITFQELVAIVLSITTLSSCLPDTNQPLFISTSYYQLLSLLETTLISAHMLWGLPLTIHELMDGARLVYYLKALEKCQGSLKSILHRLLCSEEEVEHVIYYLKPLFYRDSSFSTLEMNQNWIYDI